MGDFNLKQTDYTWKNAFLWGNFRLHCQKAATGKIGHRVVHAIIAGAELLPILSQIVSTAEKIFADKSFGKRARPLQNRAALANNFTKQNALTQLATQYASGEGVKKDLRKAIELYKQAAEQGDAEALYNLGYYYSSGGDGIKVDLDQGIAYYRKAADLNYPPAWVNLANYYLKDDLDQAISLYTKAAEQKDPVALYNLGFVYKELKKDLDQAITYYRKAADLNYLHAWVDLADCYYLKNDLDQAIALYKKAAEQKDPVALYKLGLFYKEVKKDLDQAITFFIASLKEIKDISSQDSKNVMEAFLDCYRQKKDIKGFIQSLEALGEQKPEIFILLGNIHEGGLKTEGAIPCESQEEKEWLKGQKERDLEGYKEFKEAVDFSIEKADGYYAMAEEKKVPNAKDLRENLKKLTRG